MPSATLTHANELISLADSYGAHNYRPLPVGAIGYYTYYQRVAQGLRQLMAGARKFAVKHITCDDIAALTPEAARISGLQMVSDVDRAESESVLSDALHEDVEKVLGSR